ncbi:uncharacterized protein K460DRAFT_349764 [Cucurbitaria berberidis CBS 394.84]|uniref:DUF1279 domain-containing protein n=1 Tax=Cucurbitaria berberidis CBS 394.84 TaxID=1168544 RepID=A0A9P4GPU3_9PLEO|nr:uncharacterized protein K460DRAFT_349764 [Cucurbitaria berberidis CBS 394.84]KAF1849587.1 hypothetical protein K460DRAFT_349764 [Cucurbitaria berberidis CBS 394.84]
MKTQLARSWAEPLLSGSVARRSVSRPSAPFLRNFFTSMQPSAISFKQSTVLWSRRSQPSALSRHLRLRRFKSDKPSSQYQGPTPHLGSPEPALSFSQRLKKLSREYGWSAVGVYLGLSLIDFPFCFLAVRLLGVERIGHYEDVVKSAFWSVVRLAFPDAGKKSAEEIAAAAAEAADEAAVQAKNGANASIWTQLGLAYIVHKSLIFLRVPLTAAVLPKVVKTLRKWGYDIGKKKPKPA